MVQRFIPRNFFFVTIEGLEGRADPDRYYYAKTNEESALLSKQPWQEVRMRGSIEGRFIFSAAIAHHILPFLVLTPDPVILPLEESNGHYYTMTPQIMNSKGFRDCADWMSRAEAIWRLNRGAKKSHTLLEWLDYSNKLTVQAPSQSHLVLYNAAGTNIAAAYFDRHNLDLRFIVDHKLYWLSPSTADEAHYLVSILNSDAVNRAIKPFQSTGLLGERDIHKKVLELPIPRYDRENHIYRTLSKHGA